jgi:hypothetical protein
VQEKRAGIVPVLFSYVLEKKEQQMMERTRKQERLPEGMALMKAADGKWCPACARLSELPHRIDVLEGSLLIPPKRESCHDPGPGYDCREEAREACHAWREEEELTDRWRWLAARTELYPERNAWYLDEIEQLAGGDDTPRLHCGISVHAVVLARQTAGNDSFEVIAATGNTPDEAIEPLYQRVYEWSRMLQAEAVARS